MEVIGDAKEREVKNKEKKRMRKYSYTRLELSPTLWRVVAKSADKQNIVRYFLVFTTACFQASFSLPDVGD